jgi:hypothetical protein
VVHIVLLYQHFNSCLDSFSNSIGITITCTYGTVSELNVVKTTVHSPFTGWLIMSDFSLIPIVFHLFFTLIAVGNVDFCFSLVLIRKASSVKEKTT